MTDVDIKGNSYRIGTINAFGQLHLVRRMAPITAALMELSEEFDEKKPLDVLEPLGRVLALLPDADVEYILNTCLDAVSVRQQGGGYARVRKGGVLMYELDMMTMLTLAYHVMRENLSAFFCEVQQMSAAQTAMQASRG